MAGGVGAGAGDGDVVVRSWAEPEAFGEVFDRHYDDVWAYFARRVDGETAADLAAEVFRLGFERRRTFDPDRSSSCRPWLFGIARHLLADERGRTIRQVSLLARLPRQGDPGDSVNERLDAVDGAMLHIAGVRPDDDPDLEFMFPGPLVQAGNGYGQGVALVDGRVADEVAKVVVIHDEQRLDTVMTDGYFTAFWPEDRSRYKQADVTIEMQDASGVVISTFAFA